MLNDENLPDELDMRNAADIEWIKLQNDPAIWHEAAIAMVAYLGDKHDFLTWLVQQPRMDRATAGWLFLWLSGSRYLQGETDSFYAKIPDADIIVLLENLCRRSETIGFVEDGIGLQAGFEENRQTCLAVIRDGLVPTGITVPHAIVANPFRTETHIGRYSVHDGLLISNEFLEKSMLEMFG